MPIIFFILINYLLLFSLREMRGDINLFISEYSLGRWGWEDRNDTFVVHHGVDTKLFKPDKQIEEKENHILSVVNDWINRDWCCGFEIWQRVIKNFPFHVVGEPLNECMSIKHGQSVYSKKYECNALRPILLSGDRWRQLREQTFTKSVF